MYRVVQIDFEHGPAALHEVDMGVVEARRDAGPCVDHLCPSRVDVGQSTSAFEPTNRIVSPAIATASAGCWIVDGDDLAVVDHQVRRPLREQRTPKPERKNTHDRIAISFCRYPVHPRNFSCHYTCCCVSRHGRCCPASVRDISPGIVTPSGTEVQPRSLARAVRAFGSQPDSSTLSETTESRGVLAQKATGPGWGRETLPLGFDGGGGFISRWTYAGRKKVQRGCRAMSRGLSNVSDAPIQPSSRTWKWEGWFGLSGWSNSVMPSSTPSAIAPE